MPTGNSRKWVLQALIFLVVCLGLGLPFKAVQGRITGLFFPLAARGWPRPTPRYDRPLLSEVMYDPNGEEPASEWIEIYNPAGQDFDLSSYKVGDAWNRGDGEGMLRFPAGAVIAEGQVLVIANQAAKFYSLYGFFPDYEMTDSDPGVANLIKYSAWATRSVELTNGGDEVVLLDAGDQVVDALSWGSSNAAFDPPLSRVIQGYSLERKPANRDRDRAEDWSGQPTPDPGHVDLVWPSPTPTRTSWPTSTPTGTVKPIASPTAAVSLTPGSTPEPSVGILLLSEVLYDPAEEPGEEWIELYNPGIEVVDLSNYKVGDDQDPNDGHTEGMLRFPENATIAPGQAIIVANQAAFFVSVYGYSPDYEMNESEPAVPDMNAYPAWSSGTVLLNNAGDEVILLDGQDRVVDALSWGDSSWAFDPAARDVDEGHSLERYPPGADTDSAADWRDQTEPVPGQVDLTPPTPTNTPSPTSTPSPTIQNTPTPQDTPTPTETVTVTLTLTPTVTPQPPDHLLISEVLYNPVGVEPNLEWIEVYNPTGNWFDLAAYKIGDEETQGGNEGMLCFPEGTGIDPGQVILVANLAEDFYNAFGFLPDFEMRASRPEVPDMEKYLDWAGGNVELNNGGDEILLLDENDQIIDVVAYGNSIYPDFQPPVPGVDEGHSVERLPANADEDTSQDWIDQPDPDPGGVKLSIP